MALRIVLLYAFLLAVGTAAHAAEIKVISGSAVITVMEVLIPQFERASGHKVVADFDGAMANRIQGGEAADVVIVSRQQIESLEKSRSASTSSAKYSPCRRST